MNIRFSRLIKAASAAWVALIFVTGIPGIASASPAGITQSPNFSGYEGSTTATSATADFTVPALACTSTFSSITAGLGFTDFANDNFTSGGVYLTCANGTAEYAPYTEINDNFSFQSATINSGDLVSISLTAGANATTVKVHDLTNQAMVSASTSGPGGGWAFTGFTVGDDAVSASPSSSYPIPDFTKLTFFHTQIDGQPLTAYAPLTHYEMYSGTTLQVASSKAGVGGFSTTFEHS